MAQKIYKLFQVKRALEPWYQLSKEEQDELMAKVNKALEQVGGNRLVLCNSLWSSEHMLSFGVEEFPDIEAEQKHSQLLNELHWFRYIETETVLGTEWQSS
jgi:hypothetical protein